jgi:hypothetical protein
VAHYVNIGGPLCDLPYQSGPFSEYPWSPNFSIF